MKLRSGGGLRLSRPMNALIFVESPGMETGSTRRANRLLTFFAPLLGLVFIGSVQSPTLKAAEAKAAPSYGELAGQMLCGPLDEIERDLASFTVGTLPHEAKDLRKQLGRFRNRLDLFAFAYPTGPGKDPFLKLRDDIDKGYERMGDFKDLFDAQRIKLAEYDAVADKWSKGVRPEAVAYADPDRVRSRRDKVLKWKEKLLEPERLARYRAYVCAPDLKNFHERAATDLSRFFWGGGEGIMPQHELSGVDNFRSLAAELLARALKDYPAVQELRNLEGEIAEKFHDFRKRVRSVVKIADDIEILPPGSKPAGDLDELMNDLDDAYGDVNDKIVDLGLATESGNDPKATRLHGEIAVDWAKLREWQVRKEVPAQMNRYRELLLSLIQRNQ